MPAKQLVRVDRLLSMPGQNGKTLWPVWGHLIFELHTRHSNGLKQPGLYVWKSGEKLGLEIEKSHGHMDGSTFSASPDFIGGH